eukprot:11235440-Alexandrium_andersonii.AAC.1
MFLFAIALGPIGRLFSFPPLAARRYDSVLRGRLLVNFLNLLRSRLELAPVLFLLEGMVGFKLYPGKCRLVLSAPASAAFAVMGVAGGGRRPRVTHPFMQARRPCLGPVTGQEGFDERRKCIENLRSARVP